MIPFVNYRDKFGSELFARDLSDNVYTGLLAAGNGQSLNVPAGARFAVIGGSDYWVSKTANPDIPSGNFAAGNAEFEASVLYVQNVATLYFKAEANSKISVAFYA